MEAGGTCITDNKFPIKKLGQKENRKKKKKHTKVKEKVPPTIKKPFHYEGFHVLMFYPRNTAQMLTQVPCLVVSNFREQLFGFAATALKNPHSLLRMDEGLLSTPPPPCGDAVLPNEAVYTKFCGFT